MLFCSCFLDTSAFRPQVVFLCHPCLSLPAIGTPQAIVTRLNREITRIMHSPEVKVQLDTMTSEAVPPMTPTEFAAHQQRARDLFGEVVRRAGIKAN